MPVSHAERLLPGTANAHMSQMVIEGVCLFSAVARTLAYSK